MLRILRDIVYTIHMSSGKAQKNYEEEKRKQVEEFSKECPSLTSKREAAIAMMGDRWILAKQVNRLDSPRAF